MEEDARGTHNTTQRSGLLSAAQPIKREEELSLFCMFQECGIFLFEVVKAG